jgi:tetratricopeptide (TPR) repeat protein
VDAVNAHGSGSAFGVVQNSTILVQQVTAGAAGVVAIVERIRADDPIVDDLLIGRGTSVRQLLSAIHPGEHHQDADLARVGPRTVVVEGMGGVGKTALVRHCGSVATGLGSFSAGVYLIDMQGYNPAGGVDADAVFAPLLHSLEVPTGEIPRTPAEQAVVYQHVLAELSRRGQDALFLLDNVSSATQLRGLLPALPKHRVVVTTRDTLDMPGARRMTLDVLDEADSVALLHEALLNLRTGDARVATDQAGASALAAMCGGLPLALRIAAALLADEIDLTPTELSEQLRAVGVEGLAFGERAVAATFGLSWSRLLKRDLQAARLMRLLTLNPGPDWSTETAAALANLDRSTTAARLRVLRQAYLVQRVGPRWRMHDLVRAFAISQPTETCQLTSDDLTAAAERMLEHYTGATEQASLNLNSSVDQPIDKPTDRDRALEWFDTEHPNLLAATRFAASTERHHKVVRLAGALAHFLLWRRYLTDWVPVAALACSSADHVGDRVRVAVAATNLGSALQEVRRFDEAIVAHEAAVETFRQLGQEYGEAQTLNNLGRALRQTRRFAEAIKVLQDAANIHRRAGNLDGEAQALTNLGAALLEAMRLEEAALVLQAASVICDRTGDQHAKAQALNNLGLVCRRLGKPSKAIGAHSKAVEIYRTMNDLYREGSALNNLGAALSQVGRFAEAIEAHARDWEICRRLEDRHGEAGALNNLGGALQGGGRVDEAVDLHARAVAIFREFGDIYAASDALINVGHALVKLRRYQEAGQRWNEAIELLGDSEVAEPVRRLVAELPDEEG